LELKLKYVAEIGVNHLGSNALAQKYCDFLVHSEVDGISLQIREDEFYDCSCPWKTPFRDEVYVDFFKSIKAGGKKAGLAVGDFETAQKYMHLEPNFWKILSWGIKDLSLINLLANTGNPVFVSTGISGMDEIVKAAQGAEKDIGFIHTQLSVELEDVNLSAIASMREKTGCSVSFGLHCDDFDVLSLSLAFKPEAIFFYIKDNNDLEYPDDSYAVNLKNISGLIKKLNQLSKTIGDGEKHTFKPKTLVDDEKPQVLNESDPE